ncbi:MAG: hypothetical protein IJ523_01295 [Succinivibrionaceae bacterium]|nr:hypothetical protein [Succinivibrionaceae bacterium]
MTSITLAVAGTDTEQGKLFLEKLAAAEDLEITELYPLEKVPDEYDAVRFRGRNHLKQKLDDFDFSQVQAAIFFSSPANSRVPMLAALEAGCHVIDATDGTPLADSLMVISEVNGADMADVSTRLYVSPAAAVVSAVLALKEISDAYGIESLNITAFESVSNSGHEAVKELAGQAVSLLNGRPATPRKFPAQVAFNIIPSAIENPRDQQYSAHELNVVGEIENFMPALTGRVTFSSFTMPVFYGYCAHMTFRTSMPASCQELTNLLESSSLNEYLTSEHVTPVTHGVDRARQALTRLRPGTGTEGDFNLYAVLDNTTAGGALNCVGMVKRIAENLTQIG